MTRCGRGRSGDPAEMTAWPYSRAMCRARLWGLLIKMMQPLGREILGRILRPPDLNLPQNPTEYLTPQGLHDVIRDPRAVRAWPAMAMPSFPPDHLSDREIALVIAYLKHMAGRKQ